MSIKKLIFSFYIVFTLYASSIPLFSSLNFMDIWPGIFLMWLGYLFFNLGSRTRLSSKSKNNGSFFKSLPVIVKHQQLLFWIALFCVISTILAANFYTGNTPSKIVSSLFNNSTSLYNEYQNHAIEASIAQFSLTKIPYILMLFLMKFLLFYCTISIYMHKHLMNRIAYVYLIIVFLSHAYFGLARGTNFELFEIVLLLIYILFSSVQKKQINLKKIGNVIVAILLVLAMISVYYNRVLDRGYEFNFMETTDFYVERNSFFAQTFPAVTNLIITLYDYFGFGFYYVSTFFNNILLESFSSLINYTFLPMVSNTFESINQIINTQYIVVPPRWTPDIILLFDRIGMLLGYLVIYFIGFSWSFISINYNNHWTKIAEFMIFIQMLSFPIGNFVFISSASLLIVLVISSYWLWKIFVNKRIITGL